MKSETGFTPPAAQAQLTEGVSVAELLVEQLSYEVRGAKMRDGKMRDDCLLGRLRVSTDGLIWRKGGAHSDLFIPWDKVMEIFESQKNRTVPATQRVLVKTVRG